MLCGEKKTEQMVNLKGLLAQKGNVVFDIAKLQAAFHGFV
jgi:hypothetical protein